MNLAYAQIVMDLYKNRMKGFIDQAYLSYLRARATRLDRIIQGQNFCTSF